jgi:cytochrome b
MTSPTGRVWDLGVRTFHWSLFVAVTIALLTGFLAPRTWLRVHLIVGSVIAGLLLFRVVWGVLGTAHARFASFAYSPRDIVGHLRGIARGHPRRFVGHNPVGAVMVFSLLAALAVLTATGVIALGGMAKQGPLAAFVSFAAGMGALEVHYILAIVAAVMVGLHLAGVALESALTRENLTRAMITGRKEDAAPLPASASPRLAAAIVVGGLCVGAGGIAALAGLPPRGVQPATLDPTWAAQCGACHFAYPPSLAPAAVWFSILGDLKHHPGGADASLSPQLVTQLRAYAVANSAEHWDTLPANVFRRRDPAHPWLITATPYWRRMHADIPDAVFAEDAVGSKGACDACHRDAATGRFAPQAIAIP